MIRHFMSRQFTIFLATGGAAAVVNFSSRIVYNLWVSFSTAVLLAYVTGMITAFVLAKLFVFTESQQALHRSAFFFVLVNLFAMAQTWIISMGMAYYLLPAMAITHYSREIANAVGIVFPVFTSYLGHKYYSFR